eukprot:5920995-Pyramimonas_sp.AAC.1
MECKLRGRSATGSVAIIPCAPRPLRPSPAEWQTAKNTWSTSERSRARAKCWTSHARIGNILEHEMPNLAETDTQRADVCQQRARAPHRGSSPAERKNAANQFLARGSSRGRLTPRALDTFGSAI